MSASDLQAALAGPAADALHPVLMLAECGCDCREHLT